MQNNSLLLQWNANGVRSRYSEIQNLASTYNPNFIVICESRLNSKFSFKFPNYTVFRFDRHSPNNSAPGGGLLTLVRSDLAARRVDHPQFNRDTLVVETILNGHLTHIISIYDSNGHGNIAQLKLLLSNFPGQKIVLGDFNARNTAWGSPSSTDHSDRLLDCLNDADVCCLNSGLPTYFCPRYGTSSHLDLTFVSPVLLASLDWSVLQTGTSDHFPILVKKLIPDQLSSNIRRTWKLKQANWKNFCNALPDEPPPPLPMHCTNSDIDNFALDLTSCIISAASASIGTSGCSPSSVRSPPWWNDACQRAVDARDEARKIAITSPLLSDYVNYKKIRAQTKRLLADTKTESWKTFADSLTTDASLSFVWNRARNLSTKFNFTYPPLSCPNGTQAITALERATALIQPYDTPAAKSPASAHLDTLFPDYPPTAHTLPEYDCPFSEAELLNAMSILPDGATGPDRIHNAFLKHLPQPYKLSLLHLYNACWHNGHVPTVWKSSELVPILKPNKDSSIPTNYRPITLSSCSLKLLEKLVAHRLTHFLESHHVLPPYQFGFRKGYSCEMALNKLTTDLKEACANSEYTACAFLDLKSAFDSTTHSAILASLREAKVPHHIYHFCAALISDRTLSMSIDGQIATTFLHRGVPQGSVLAPHLFSVVVNHIPAGIPNSVIPSLYADDCKAHVSNRSLPLAVYRLNAGLQRFHENAQKWELTFDPAKCKVLLFYHTRKRPTLLQDVLLDGSALEIVHEHRFLGLIFDDRLTWKAHVDHILSVCHKILNCLRMLSSLRWGSSPQALRTLFLTLVRSRIAYGITSYGDCRATIFDRLQKFQNLAFRKILGLPPGTPNAALHILMDLPTLVQFRSQTLVRCLGTAISKKRLDCLTCVNDPDEVLRWPVGTPVLLSAHAQSVSWNIHRSLRFIESVPVFPPRPPWLAPRSFGFHLNWLDQPKNAVQPDQLLRLFEVQYDKLYDPTIDVLFTDGSLDPASGRNGFGVFWPNRNINLERRLPDGPSICSVELYAIKFAVFYALDHGATKLLIVSDSLSALSAIQSRNPSYAAIHDLYSVSSDFPITFLWAPSHVGIPSNETADRLAAAALSNAQTEVVGGIPLHDFHLLTKSSMRQAWSNEWRNGDTARLLASVTSAPGLLPPPLLRSRLFECATNRLLCDRINSMKLRFLYKRATSPLCPDCSVSDDSRHFLLSCSRYRVQRTVLLTTLTALQCPLSIRAILGGVTNPPHTRLQIHRALDVYIRSTTGYDYLLGATDM